MLPFVMLPRPLQESNVVGKGGTAGFLGKAYDPYYLYPPGGDMDMGKMDKMNTKLDEVHEDMNAGFQDLKLSLGTIVNSLEAVRTTIVNMDKSPVPAIFIIEIPPESQKDSPKKQMKRNDMERIFNPRNMKDQVQEAVAGKSLTLRLLCQASGEPVGDGYVIKDP